MSGTPSPKRQYRAPDVAAGDRLVCAIAGEVEVETFSHTRIHWPISTDLKIIFCGDLLEALRTEPVVVVAQIWEVSKGTVQQWRKQLASTRQHALVPDPAIPGPDERSLEIAGPDALQAALKEPEAATLPHYVPPDAQLGDTLRCALAGDVIVSGFLDGPAFLWPQYRTGATGRLVHVVCGDLLRALRELHKTTISTLWEVSHTTVQSWRKQLGIPASEAGRLQPALAQFAPRLTAPVVSVGDILKCAATGPCEVAAFGPAPLAWPLRKVGPVHLEPILCGELVTYVRQASVTRVAKLLNISPVMVERWRTTLANPDDAPAPTLPHGLAWDAAIAEPHADAVQIAQRFGVPPRVVRRARRERAARLEFHEPGPFPGHATISTLLTCWPLSRKLIANWCGLTFHALMAYLQRAEPLPETGYRSLCRLLGLSVREGATDADGDLPLPAGRYVLLASDNPEDVASAYGLLSWDGDVAFCAELVTDAPEHADSAWRYLLFSAPGEFAPHLIVFPREGPSVGVLDGIAGLPTLAGYRGTFPVDACTYACVAEEWQRVMVDPRQACRAFAESRDIALLARLQQLADSLLLEVREQDLAPGGRLNPASFS